MCVGSLEPSLLFMGHLSVDKKQDVKYDGLHFDLQINLSMTSLCFDYIPKGLWASVWQPQPILSEAKA